MKPVAFALLAPLVAAPLLATLGTVPRPVPTRDQPLTLVITTLDSAKADAFIGNLRFAGVRAVYSDGSEAAAGSAKRVAAAIGAPITTDTLRTADAERDAQRLADQVLESRSSGVGAVVLDSGMVLPFLRRVTGQARSSFPLSGARGRMWVVTITSGYTSAVRGSY